MRWVLTTSVEVEVEVEAELGKRKDLLMDPFTKIFICERFRFTEFRDIFLSSSGMITLICIIFFKSLVIVVHEKCLPGPKLGCEIWLPV